MNNISVIIPTMNRISDLKKTIESYVMGSIIPSQLIIVDQTTDQQMQKEIESLCMSFCLYTNVDYIHEKTPSLTHARNEGVKRAVNDIVVMSDDDITIQSNTIENILKIMTDVSVAMIAGLDLCGTTNSTDTKLGYFFQKKSWKNRNIGHVTKSLLGRFPMQIKDSYVNTQWAMGFFFVVKKSLLIKWNLRWDEKLTGYGYPEDLDFSYRYYRQCKCENLKCIMSKDVVVEHRVSKDARIPNRKATMMYVINREYLSYKLFPSDISTRLATRWCNLGDFFYRIIRGEKPMDMFYSQIRCDVHRAEIKNGIIKPEWYE